MRDQQDLRPFVRIDPDDEKKRHVTEIFGFDE